jgi:molecular chaperone GrpE
MSTESRESKSSDIRAGSAAGTEEPIPIRVTDRRRVTEESLEEPLGEDSKVVDPGESADASQDVGQGQGQVNLEKDLTSEGGGDPTEMRDRLEEMTVRLAEAERQVQEAERQVQEVGVRFRSAQAQLRVEADEQRARLQRTFDQKIEGARAELVASLLETLDNLKRAIQAAESTESGTSNLASQGGSDPRFASLLEGVRATAQLFEAKMQSLGLTPILAVGEAFDPELHEAVEIVSVPPELDNQVMFEYQTGYRLGERLLRPSRVRVGRA